jgi:molybdate-binding protein
VTSAECDISTQHILDATNEQIPQILSLQKDITFRNDVVKSYKRNHGLRNNKNEN